MILDICMIVLVAVLVMLGIRRGLMSSLFGWLSAALAGFLAYLAGKGIANWVFTSSVSPAIAKSVNESLSSGSVEASAVTEKALSDLPSFFTGLLGMFGINADSVSGSVTDISRSASEAVSQTIISAIKPVVVSALSFVFILVLFILFFFLLRLLSGRLLRLFDLPGLHAVNAVLGGVLGMGEGIVICLVAVMLLRIILPFVDNPFITEEMISSSFFFKAIYHSAFMDYVADVINSGSARNAVIQVSETVAPTVSVTAP